MRVRVRVRVRGLHPAGGLAADLDVEIYARVVGAARLLERHGPPLGVAAGRLEAAAPRLVRVTVTVRVRVRVRVRPRHAS